MATGNDLILLAKKHLGEPYVLGAAVPKDAANYRGPWDCAEFASWLIYQVSRQLYGCVDDSAPPHTADAFTGAWAADAARLGRKVTVEEAARTPGAFVLRRPNEAGIKVGHIVLSDGRNGTIEAHSSKDGVIQSTLSGRTWTCGIVVPGIDCAPVDGATPPAPPTVAILRLTDPPMKGEGVRQVQRQLKAAGFDAGGIDGVYGHRTMTAVAAFQAAKGLVPDGEVGPLTAKALARAAG